MPTCFIICPIGDSDTQTRRDADDLRDLIITPALEPFGFKIDRGDHHAEPGKIDSAVIRAVQEADLCVVDISQHNPNVYYELGRREETGKPLVLVRSVRGEEIPVDIATHRYVEYDLDSRSGLKNAILQMKAFVEPIVKRGFEATGSGATLSEVAEILKRVERQVDRIAQGSNANANAVLTTAETNGSDPRDMLRLALRQRNIPLAEQAMDVLAVRMDRHQWLDAVVEQVAGIGSVRAGDILLENIDTFMDNASTFKEKVEYFSFLITNMNRTGREEKYCERIDQLYTHLKAFAHNEEPASQVSLHNAQNRLCYGLYARTKEKAWLDKAIRAIGLALEICDTEPFLYYNLSICEEKRREPGDMDKALEHALRCVQLAGDKKDVSHLSHLCELMHELDDPRLSDYMEMLEKVDPVRCQILRGNWKN